jgi:hypothetical protein
MKLRFIIALLTGLGLSLLVAAGEPPETPASTAGETATAVATATATATATAAAVLDEIDKQAAELLEEKDLNRCRSLAQAILGTEKGDKAVLDVLDKRKREPAVIAAILDSVGFKKRYKAFQDQIVGPYFEHTEKQVRDAAISAACDLLKDDTPEAKEFLELLRGKANEKEGFELVRLCAIQAIGGVEIKNENLIREIVGELVALAGDSKKSISRAAVKAIHSITKVTLFKTADEIREWWKTAKEKSPGRWIIEVAAIMGVKLKKERLKRARESIKYLNLIKKTEPGKYAAELRVYLEHPGYREYAPLLLNHLAKEASALGKSEFLPGLLMI